MSPEQLERVFGRGRLQMKTGRHVEVFREAAAPGERRRYTKRFLATQDGDFRAWTEREWRMLARLVGHGLHCVPDVVQFDRGAGGGAALVQTYDAGVTLDHWTTLLPVERAGPPRPPGSAQPAAHRFAHPFADCAHWWALAHHGLAALEQVHRLQLVHLDVKADNVCIPYAPLDFEPAPGRRLRPVFGELALIDFAFSIVTGEPLAMPLPIGWQRDYAYQSPRLLHALEAGRAGDLAPTRALDWRCDLFSFAAMLERYLPPPPGPAGGEDGGRGAGDGWTSRRLGQARSLLQRLREAHDREAPGARPHAGLIDFSGELLREPDLAESLEQGWTLALDAQSAPAENAPTPVTRLAPPLGPDPGGTPRASSAGPAAPQGIAAPAAPGTEPGTGPGARTGREPGPGLEMQPEARPAADPGPAPGPSSAAGPGGGDARRRARPPLAGPRGRRLVWPAVTLVGLAILVPPALDAVRGLSEAAAPMREAVRRVLGPGAPEPAPAAQRPAENFEQRARRLLATRVPEIAERMEDPVDAVLATAARAGTTWEDEGVRGLARQIHAPSGVPLDGSDAPAEARQLNAAAREAYWVRGDMREALTLQLRAFGARPGDAEIAGNLAFLQLRQQPPRPQEARRLALHALAVAGRQFPGGRAEDWGTLAVASALLGRERDAGRALLVMLAVHRDPERSCRAALAAVATYGRAMRAPAETLLLRVRERGGSAAPSCRWPPDWRAGARVP